MIGRVAQSTHCYNAGGTGGVGRGLAVGIGLIVGVGLGVGVNVGVTVEVGVGVELWPCVAVADGVVVGLTKRLFTTKLISLTVLSGKAQ